jgi:hypothetical protein
MARVLVPCPVPDVMIGGRGCRARRRIRSLVVSPSE